MAVRDSLPDDISAEVYDVLKNKKRFRTPRSVLICSLLLILLCVLFYCFLPDPSSGKEKNSVSAVGLVQSSRVYQDLYDKTDELYRDHQYSVCAETLSGFIQHIVNEQDPDSIQQNGKLIHRYFDSLLKCADSVSVQDQKSRAFRDIHAICEADPDCIHWQLFRLRLDPELRLEGERYQAAEASNKRELNYHLWQKLKNVLRQFPQYRKLKYADDPDIAYQLDLFETKLNVEIWLLTSLYSKWGQTLNDHGVVNREKAFATAKQRGNENSIEFLNIQLFIVRKVREKTGKFSSYTIDGETRFWGADLDSMEQEIKHHIRELEDRK